MSELALGAAYRECRERIAALVRDAGGEAAADRPVPATPAWNVHDVVAHLRGIVDDARNGNMAGAPGEAWTAAQVERGRATGVELLLEEWADDSPAIEGVLDSPAGAQLTALLMDVHTHEQDLRGALDRPGERSGAFYAWATPKLAAGFRARAMGAELPSVRVVLDSATLGDDDDPVELRISDWEMFRVVLGRRSPGQISRLAWTGADDPAAYVAPLVVFGPAAHDVVE